MNASTTRVVAWSACLAALWMETAALLAWTDGAFTAGDLALSTVIAVVLALFLATNKLATMGMKFVEHIGLFILGLAFVELDCSGTLRFIGRTQPASTTP